MVQRGGGLVIAAAILSLWLGVGVGSAQGPASAAEGGPAARATVGPALPFADNPDPTMCGIPQAMGAGVTAVVDGHWRGRLYEDDVVLYDSHLRQSIRGTLPTGTPVAVVMFQSNPSLDYYFVRGNAGGVQVEGWVPAPFVRDVGTR